MHFLSLNESEVWRQLGDRIIAGENGPEGYQSDVRSNREHYLFLNELREIRRRLGPFLPA